MEWGWSGLERMEWGWSTEDDPPNKQITNLTRSHKIVINASMHLRSISA